MLYFAYGSNMNGARMAGRVPAARKVGIARLPGWRLRERLYADAEPCMGGEVFGVLWELDADGFARLDRFEGSPSVYVRTTAPVEIPGGERRTAFVSTMTPASRAERKRRKYPDQYRKICSDGARENGLPDAFAD